MNPSDTQEPEAVAPFREARPSIPEDGFDCFWLIENGRHVGELHGPQNDPIVIARAQHWSRPALDREAVARIIDPEAFEAWDRAEGNWRKDEAKVRCWPAEEKADAILARIEGRT